jgi:hypothetical protein
VDGARQGPSRARSREGAKKGARREVVAGRVVRLFLGTALRKRLATRQDEVVRWSGATQPVARSGAGTPRPGSSTRPPSTGRRRGQPCWRERRRLAVDGLPPAGDPVLASTRQRLCQDSRPARVTSRALIHASGVADIRDRARRAASTEDSPPATDFLAKSWLPGSRPPGRPPPAGARGVLTDQPGDVGERRCVQADAARMVARRRRHAR